MTTQRQTFVAPTSEQSFTLHLQQCLHLHGYTIRQTVQQTGAEYRTARSSLREDETLHSDVHTAPAQVISWWTQPLSDMGIAEEDSAEYAMKKVYIEADGRWDANLARCLSKLCGGFVIGMEDRSLYSHEGVGLFYAGRTIELYRHDYHHGEQTVNWQGQDDMFSTYQLWWQAVTGERAWRNDSYTLAHHSDTLMHTLYVQQKSGYDAGALAPHLEPALSQIALAYVEEAAFVEAVESMNLAPEQRQGWYWLPLQTPVYNSPYILLRRESSMDDALAMQLAQRLNSPGVCMELPPLAVCVGEKHTSGFRWAALRPEQTPHWTQSVGAEAFMNAWSYVSVVLAEEPASIYWPNIGGRVL